MTKTDELKQEISAKRKEVENFQRLNQKSAALKAADELEKLLDEYKVAESLEKTEFNNFINSMRTGNAAQVSGKNSAKLGGISATADYCKHFYDAIRGNFKNESADFLRVGINTQGGYLLPSELDEKIATKLAEENVMRRISRMIETKSRHEIPIFASQPNAQWLTEGQEIDLQSGNFDRVTVGAFKLCSGVKISNELLQDSYYNLQEFFAEEFGKALSASEEQAFVSGNGVTEPQGVLTALNAATDVSVTTTTAGSNLAIDDLINVVYSLQRPYRANACWLMHDSTIQAIRKIKDQNLQLYWTASTTEGEPPLLLGYPVHSCGYMPQYASGATIAAFGNFQQGYVIGDRSQRTFKPLFEVLALSDLSAFLMIERVDGRLVDKNAIKLLTLR